MTDTVPTLPRLAITMGDVCGVGPELVARLLVDPPVEIEPVVYGNPEVLRRAVLLTGEHVEFETVTELPARSTGIPPTSPVPVCIDACDVDVSAVPTCVVDARAGRAAHDWLIAATDAALSGEVDGIVTAPLNKAALAAAGVTHPGHTEILAERCGADEHAMMLYLPGGSRVANRSGLAIAHATLHTSIASVPRLLTTARVGETIRLVNSFLQRIGVKEPRIGLCALNPHAGEDGLFGREEADVITPAALHARAEGINVSGPAPADTLIMRAVRGEFDGVAAMYHDQGHIAVKLLGFDEAVNITLGLPIVRTSPAQGTAFDIAWRGVANPTGIRAAASVACELIASSR